MNELEVKEIDKTLKMTLIELKINCDWLGFLYLYESLKVAIVKPMYVYNLRSLFDHVGGKLNVAPALVEINIQNALKALHKTKSFMKFNDFFKIQIFKKDDKPRMAQIIALLVEFFNLGLYKEVELGNWG